MNIAAQCKLDVIFAFICGTHILHPIILLMMYCASEKILHFSKNRHHKFFMQFLFMQFLFMHSIWNSGLGVCSLGFQCDPSYNKMCRTLHLSMSTCGSEAVPLVINGSMQTNYTSVVFTCMQNACIQFILTCVISCINEVHTKSCGVRVEEIQKIIL